MKETLRKYSTYLVFNLNFSDRYEVSESSTKKPYTQNDEPYNGFGFSGPGGPTGPSGPVGPIA